ncbi:HAD family hydrolase [Candidatus Uhrbacteria bacterium]|nr:HAD family hydrolase [Candidatus Uhrbacteria bacterium]
MSRNITPICIDLDHTLLDTLRIREDVYAHSRSYGVTRARAKEAYRAAVAQRFTPSRYVAHLGLSRADSRSLLAEIVALVRASDQYVFPGVRFFLSKAQRIAPLYLVTHGDARYQKEKLRYADLEKYFTSISVTPEKAKYALLERLYRTYRGRILMIDDSRAVYASARAIGFPFLKVKKGEKGIDYFRTLLKRVQAFTANTMSHD